MRKKIQDAGYHVACGMAMATPDRKLSEVLEDAEMRMYQDKRDFYDSIGKDMR